MNNPVSKFILFRSHETLDSRGSTALIFNHLNLNPFSLVVSVNVFVTDIAILLNHVMAVWSVLVFLVKLKSVIRICAQSTVNGHNGLIGQNVLAHVTVVSEIADGRAMRHNVVENSVKATQKKLPGATVSHVLPMERGQTGHSGHNAVFHVVVE